MAKIEKIDQKILNLVGIFDYEAEMDYDEYTSLLKERMMADRMGQRIDSADASDIKDEWKRVKGKKGRFKVGLKQRSKKFVNGGEQKLLTGTQFTKLDKKKILPPSSIEDTGGVKKGLNVKQQINPWESISKSINAIQISINGIANILNKKNKIERAQQRVDVRVSNTAKRKKKENELENKGIKAVKNIASKVMKPVKSFWDSILNFFKWILLGAAVKKILEIIKNPEIILKPLRDFVNGIIDFLNGLIDNIFNFFSTPLNFLIDGINNGIGFLYDRFNDIRSLVSNLPGVNLEPVEKPERIDYVEKPDWLENMKIERWEKDDNKVQGLAGGGVTSNSGRKITGMGPDTQLIAAQPGEVVMSKKAVDYWGLDNLLSMNKEGGGTNISSFGSGPIQRMSGGGVVPFPEGSYKRQHGQVFGDSRSYGGHVGIDVTENSPYKSDPKRPIYAPVNSKVLSERFSTSGYTSGLMLDHGDGLQSRYVHMHPMKRPGDSVKAGEQIGKLRALGKSPSWNQTHLHFELYRGSKLLNPTSFYQSLVDGSYKPSTSRGTGDLDKFSAGEGGVGSISSNNKSTVNTSISRASATGGSGPRIVFVGGDGGGDQSNSSAGANQNVPSTFSSIDSSNSELIVIKSIYNIVG